MTARPRDRETGLWFLIAGPTIWAAHFLVSYVAAAIYCAKAAAPQDLSLVQGIVAGATIVALAGIALTAMIAARKWELGVGGWRQHPEPTLEARKRFLGHSAWLLCALSAVAVLLVALPAIFSASCV